MSAVDDIQVMLDDNILKAQTMRGSPYVKAFEKEMQKWEEKLVSMQDILEAWLAVSATIFKQNILHRNIALVPSNLDVLGANL